MAKQGVKTFERLEGQEMPKLVAMIDGLEAFVIKSLKNKLNEDNKKS